MNNLDQEYIKIIENNQINFQLPENVEEEGHILKIEGYCNSPFKKFWYYFFSIITAGFYFLLCRWYLNLRIKGTLKQSNIDQAEFLKITCKDGTFELIPIYNEKLADSENSDKCIKTFQYRLYKYFYDKNKLKFIPIIFSLTHLTNNKIHENYGKGFQSKEQVDHQRFMYGINSTEVPEKPLLNIFIDEVLSPFFLFQAFSCALWFADSYEIYAGIIVFMAIFSMILELHEAKSNMRNLREMSFFECKINNFRGLSQNLLSKENETILEKLQLLKKEISSFDLVPGDVIEIPENGIMPCDIILLNGTCIMNESMLTGESIPIVKTSLPYNGLYFNPLDENKSCILFAGTKCIESRYYMKGKIPILGLVYQTGFNTMKGQLVRSILFPKSGDFNFYKDALRFILSISVITLAGLIYSVVNFLHEGAETKDIVLKSLDMVTVTVPPALPACMSIGISFALARLKKRNIFCISPQKINVSGKVNIMCFDKTGTLTEEGLETYGVRVTKYDGKKNAIKFSSLQKSTNFSFEDKEILYRKPKELPSVLFQSKKTRSQLFMEVLGSCHSITSVNGELIGDPLDIKMFEWSGFIMEDNENKYDELVLAVIRPKGSKIEEQDFDSLRKSIQQNYAPNEIGIIKRFEFSSKLQRMSVIVRNLNENKFRVYVKGSPEKLREICKPDTIPHDFHQLLDFYSRNGYRVLACGSRTLRTSIRNIDSIERQELETDLTFLGLLIMENKLKPETKPIIQQLQTANVRTIMVTGDNILTAISVAKQCSLVNPNQRVYLGDLSEKIVNGKYNLIWKDFDFSDHSLNPDTLIPEEKDDDDEELYDKNFLCIKEEEKDDVDMLKLNKPKKHKKREDKKYQSLFNEEIIHSFKQEKIHPKISNSFDHSKTDIETPQSQEIKEELDVQLLNYIDDEIPPWLTQENSDFILALSGKAFSFMLDELNSQKNEKIFKKMIEKAQIFARMKPTEKTTLIQSLQKYIKNGVVGMCGDGANDCGALKAADVGMSLSEAEASIAAPFTSKTPNISCVVELLREGRCALATSFQCFKYMALYSMTQFGGVTFLHGSMSNFSNWEYMWIDICTILPLAIFMSYSQAYSKLSKYLPSSNLVSFAVLSSVIGQIFIQFAFQGGLFGYIRANLNENLLCENLKKNVPGDMSKYWKCYENAYIFYFCNFQYLSTVFAFSIGKPFRKPFYKNYLFTISLLILVTLATLMLWCMPESLQKFFPLISIDFDWKLRITILAIINFIVTYCYEKYCVGTMTSIWRKLKEKNRKGNI